MKKNILLSVAASFLIAGSSVYAASSTEHHTIDAKVQTDKTIHSFWALSHSPDHLTKKQLDYFKSVGLLKTHRLIEKEIKQAKEHTSKAPKEVTLALQSTVKAMAYLEKNETSKAEKQLKKATKLFDEVLKKEPSLKLVPIDTDIDLVAHKVTLDEAKQIKKDALKTLKENKPQETIALLETLKNQMTITTTSLPMDLYPVATKKALELLKKHEKKEKVLATLSDGLDTLVTVEVVIPLPLLVAQDATEEASKLSKKKPKEAAKLLNVAQTQLNLAEYEGYLSEKDKIYHTLHTEIKSLQDKIGEGNILEKDFDKAKEAFKKMFDAIHSGSKK